MIAYLQGKLLLRDDPTILLDVQGVGYKILAARDVLSRATDIGSVLSVYTFTYVREDSLELFGFVSYEDLRLFELLISVSGIGPKTALGIYSVGGKEDITQAILSENTAFFSSVPRLGTKNAQKIIIELKSKLGGLGSVKLDQLTGQNKDVVEALTSLGFSPKEVQSVLLVLRANEANQTLSPEQQIKLALKYLGK